MGMARNRGLALALAAAMIHNCDAVAGVIKMPWTNDEALFAFAPGQNNATMGTYGPDGPWQAVALLTGSSTGERGVLVPVWPTNSEVTELVSTTIGGGYAHNRTATRMLMEKNGQLGQLEIRNYDSWYSAYFATSDNLGLMYHDNVTILNHQDRDFSVNVSVLDADMWNVRVRDGVNYTATVGNLGLSPLGPSEDPAVARAMEQKGIVEQLADAGSVSSNFWSLHMGSVMMAQPGSLLLGGYEQNRALGPVGAFNFDGVLGLFLLDVFLGVEEGESPFNVSAAELGSVWQGVSGEMAKLMSKTLGAKAGSALAVPSPGSPGIYLPPGTCRAAASYLPVTWDNTTGYWLWNTADPSYARIVNSPAYLGFVFADRTAANITIKVPFRLLDLRLESPIVKDPTPYFPCTSHESELGFWAMGRAFLQAAFLGVSYDQQLLFLAQAPGPDMAQSVTRTVSPNDTTLASNPLDSFAASWRSRWTAIKKETRPSATGSAPASTASPDSDQTGLSTGAKAGIAVGAVAAVALALAAAVLFICWRRRKAYDSVGDDNTAVNSADSSAGEPKSANELGIDTGVFETGQPLAHEVEAKDHPRELPCYVMAVELPAVVPSPPYSSPVEAPAGSRVEMASGTEEVVQAGQGGQDGGNGQSHADRPGATRG